MNSGDGDQTGEISVGEGTPIRDEIAQILRRVMDRVLPESRKKAKLTPRPIRYFVTFLGALLWYIIAFLFMQMVDKQPIGPFSTPSEVFGPSLVADTARLVGFLTEFLYPVVAGCLVIGVIFAALVAETFKHGKPLFYFFCGLIYPTLAVSVVSSAFLF